MGCPCGAREREALASHKDMQAKEKPPSTYLFCQVSSRLAQRRGRTLCPTTVGKGCRLASAPGARKQTARFCACWRPRLGAICQSIPPHPRPHHRGGDSLFRFGGSHAVANSDPPANAYKYTAEAAAQNETEPAATHSGAARPGSARESQRRAVPRRSPPWGTANKHGVCEKRAFCLRTGVAPS